MSDQVMTQFWQDFAGRQVESANLGDVTWLNYHGPVTVATLRKCDVICVAHVTNAMATDGDDFEKGEADGAHDALDVVAAIIERLRGSQADAVTSHAAPPIRTPEVDS